MRTVRQVRRTPKQAVVVAPERAQWRQQFVLLCRHVQRLQDAQALWVRRLPQLQADYEALQTEYQRVQAAYANALRRTRTRKGRR
jgi:hypothetical protein